MNDPQETLVRYLQEARDAVLWKLEGLSDYDVRRPLTPTGTNLLGLVKHLASIELGYFGDTFGRPHAEQLPWYDDEGADPNADLWASADETREEIVGHYQRAWAHAAETFAALDLDAPGQVPWWGPERGQVTLHQILVHVLADTTRHGGHADIVRELIDGAVGMNPESDNLPERGYDWVAHHAQVERAAREFTDGPAD